MEIILGAIFKENFSYFDGITAALEEIGEEELAMELEYVFHVTYRKTLTLTN